LSERRAVSHKSQKKFSTVCQAVFATLIPGAIWRYRQRRDFL